MNNYNVKNKESTQHQIQALTPQDGSVFKSVINCMMLAGHRLGKKNVHWKKSMDMILQMTHSDTTLGVKKETHLHTWNLYPLSTPCTPPNPDQEKNNYFSGSSINLKKYKQTWQSLKYIILTSLVRFPKADISVDP